jgi:2-hydroxychromene-2-carboxylate isomerase
MTTKPVDYFFDYASPWAFLADKLLARNLPGVTLAHQPIYLRGLESFSKGIPYTGAKLQYVARDLARCAEHEGVTIAPPASFPLDGLQLLRGAYVAMDKGAFDRFHRAAFDAAWAEQKEVSKKEVAASILADALGSNEAAALEAMAAQPIKDRVRDATAKAAERGVFGTPTWFVGDEMFWGHDRMDYVARAAKSPIVIRERSRSGREEQV